MVSVSELREVVNWKEGLISPTVLFDEELYREEQTKVFEKAWLVVGHEDMLRKPGDYVTNYMGEVPVVVSRDMEGELHVLVNRCVHRGNEVCLFDRGNARAFTCSYHGWTYEISGKLIGVPMEKELYRDEIDHESWGLEQVRGSKLQGADLRDVRLVGSFVGGVVGRGRVLVAAELRLGGAPGGS